MKQGMRVRVRKGNGVHSERKGVIIPWEESSLRPERYDLSVPGIATVRGILHYVALRDDNGNVFAVPKASVKKAR